MAIEKRPDIDWSKFVDPVDCECAHCVAQLKHGDEVPIFQSAVACFYVGAHRGMWSKDPCPTCGNHRLHRMGGVFGCSI